MEVPLGYGFLFALVKQPGLFIEGIKESVTKKRKTTIGWKETVDLPDWGIYSILAKADTGARRSAIDVKRLHTLPGGLIEFDIVLNRKDRDYTHTVRCPVSHQSRVRSSNGQQHERYFVKTRIRIGEHEKQIELSLVCRKTMICRMLLGRKALESTFVVDSGAKYLTKPRRKAVVRKQETEQ